MGFNVTEFSIGLGPKVIKFKKNGITYASSLFPIGGKVSIKGENPNESKDEKGDFHNAQPIKKLLVALAGPLSNIAMTLFIFFGLAFTSTQLKNKSYSYRVQKSIQFSDDSTIDWSKKKGNGLTSLFIEEANATEQASLSGPLVLTKLAIHTYKVSFRIISSY